MKEGVSLNYSVGKKAEMQKDITVLNENHVRPRSFNSSFLHGYRLSSKRQFFSMMLALSVIRE